MAERTCCICASRYTARSTQQKTCSRACRTELRRRNNAITAKARYHRNLEASRRRERVRPKRSPRGMHERSCLWCGDRFTERRVYGRLGCRSCRKTVRPERPAHSVVPWADCGWCGHAYIARGRKRYCGQECARNVAYVQHYGNATAIVWSDCGECGRTFSRRASAETRRFCSEVCATRSDKRYRRHIARTKNGGDRISIAPLGERDRWQCHICSEPVRKPPWSGEIDDATIDHLTPVSKGGTHTWDNVALAHWMCNSLRGDADLVA